VITNVNYPIYLYVSEIFDSDIISGDGCIEEYIPLGALTFTPKNYTYNYRYAMSKPNTQADL